MGYSFDYNSPEIPSPCYVLEEPLLERNLKLLNRVRREAGVTVLCALKGFAMWSAFPLVKQYLNGATASSLNEAKLCFEELGTLAHVCAPVYTDREFDQLLPISSHITFNSLSQWERFKGKLQAFEDRNISAAIRINPEYSEVETDLYNPCVPGSRLGVRPEHLGEQLPEGIEGLHFHSLCEQDSFVLERTLEKVEEKYAHLLHQAKWLNIGGGHHVTRKDYDVDHLISLLKAFKEKFDLEIIMEPGEAVGWQTGVLVSTVEDIVESKGIQVLMLDVSFSAHMPDCLEMPYRPEITGGMVLQQEKPSYRLGGGTCLAGDFLGDYSFEKELQVGDRLVFEDMIHYTMVKTTMFNGVHHPAIAKVDATGKFSVVREFGYEDYRDRLS